MLKIDAGGNVILVPTSGVKQKIGGHMGFGSGVAGHKAVNFSRPWFWFFAAYLNRNKHVVSFADWHRVSSSYSTVRSPVVELFQL